MAGVAGAMTGAQMASKEAAASDVLRSGLNLFIKEAEAKAKVKPEIKKGNLFEYILAAKFNLDAARKGSSAKAVVNAARGRRGPSDIDIISNGKTVLEAQLKAGGIKYETDGLSRPIYDGMQKIVPTEQVDSVRKRARMYSNSKPSELRNYKDMEATVRGDLRYGPVSSGKTTSAELVERATQSPGRYAIKQNLLQMSQEVAVTSVDAAGAGVVMGFAESAIKNFRRDIDGGQAAQNVITDAVMAGGRSGVTGALGAVIRNSASRGGLKVLSRSNVATAVAAGLIEVGVVVYDYAKGKIDSREAGERLGGAACGTASSIGIGAAAGLVAGPAGSVVGGIVGYLLSSQVYQSCLAVFKGARLAEEEALRVVALCNRAVRDLYVRRARFEEWVASCLGNRQATFDRCFTAIDDALLTNQPDNCVRALGDLVSTCGQTLQFGSFQDFDRFMTKTKNPLIF